MNTVTFGATPAAIWAGQTETQSAKALLKPAQPDAVTFGMASYGMRSATELGKSIQAMLVMPDTTVMSPPRVSRQDIDMLLNATGLDRRENKQDKDALIRASIIPGDHEKEDYFYVAPLIKVAIDIIKGDNLLYDQKWFQQPGNKEFIRWLTNMADDDQAKSLREGANAMETRPFETRAGIHKILEVIGQEVRHYHLLEEVPGEESYQRLIMIHTDKAKAMSQPRGQAVDEHAHLATSDEQAPRRRTSLVARLVRAALFDS